MAQEKIKELAALLESGCRKLFEEGGLKAFLDATLKLCRLDGGCRYTLNNALLILSQCPGATIVGGFRAWQEQGRFVKKGEKAIWILAPCTCHKKSEDTSEEEEEAEKDKSNTFISFRAVPVFDISQTDGKPLPEGLHWEPLKGEVSGMAEILEGIKAISPVPISFVPQKEIGTALGAYFPKLNVIKVSEELSQEETVDTLLHEIAHSMLHNREAIEGRKNAGVPTSREVKEVEAESVAYIVSGMLGIDTAASSFVYVAGWAKDGGEKLSASLERIEKCASEMWKGLEAVFQATSPDAA